MNNRKELEENIWGWLKTERFFQFFIQKKSNEEILEILKEIQDFEMGNFKDILQVEESPKMEELHNPQNVDRNRVAFHNARILTKKEFELIQKRNMGWQHPKIWYFDNSGVGPLVPKSWGNNWNFTYFTPLSPEEFQKEFNE